MKSSVDAINQSCTIGLTSAIGQCVRDGGACIFLAGAVLVCAVTEPLAKFALAAVALDITSSALELRLGNADEVVDAGGLHTRSAIKIRRARIAMNVRRTVPEWPVPWP